MSKLRIPHMEQRKAYTLRNLVISLLQLGETYVSERDIELYTSPTWRFWKLSVFRWSDAGSGCGTRKSRDKRWEILQEELRELFEHEMKDDHSWRWLPHNGYDMSIPYDNVYPDKENFIVGRTFYIKKGPLLLDGSLFNDEISIAANND